MPWEPITRRNIPWSELEDLQKKLQNRILEGDLTSYLLISEPQPTLTAGRTAELKDLILSEDVLASRGIKIEKVSRGGEWTYHGPGQVVIFPICSLENLGLHSKASRFFVERLRTAVQKGLRDLDIVTEIGDEPFGLYSDGAKVASFGLDFSKGVSGHGVAVYVEDQSVGFQSINPCGVVGPSLSCLRRLCSSTVSWSNVAQSLVNSIKNSFQLP